MGLHDRWIVSREVRSLSQSLPSSIAAFWSILFNIWLNLSTSPSVLSVDGRWCTDRADVKSSLRSCEVNLLPWSVSISRGTPTREKTVNVFSICLWISGHIIANDEYVLFSWTALGQWTNNVHGYPAEWYFNDRPIESLQYCSPIRFSVFGWEQGYYIAYLMEKINIRPIFTWQ